MRYQTILFDLDGTLTDPAVGITNSIMYALRKAGLPVGPREAYYKFIGPPLRSSYMRYCGVAEDEAAELIRYYREYFSEYGLFENAVYPGIPEALGALKRAGARLVLATAKPEPFTLRILEHFDLGKYFDFVAGSTIDETRAEKEEVVAYALEALGIRAPGGVVMVGDRENDMRGARLNGVAALGVLYGYGDREELLSAGADALAETPEALLRLLLG